MSEDILGLDCEKSGTLLASRIEAMGVVKHCIMHRKVIQKLPIKMSMVRMQRNFGFDNFSKIINPI